MGTRHMIGVVKDGQYKVGQYGQWDGYPSGQGSVVLDFLRSADLNDFRESLNKCRFITQDEADKRYAKAGLPEGGMNKAWMLTSDGSLMILTLKGETLK